MGGKDSFSGTDCIAGVSMHLIWSLGQYDDYAILR